MYEYKNTKIHFIDTPFEKCNNLHKEQRCFILPTKVMKYQIIKPDDCEWSVLGKVFRDIQYDTRQIMNKTIQLCWEWQGFSSEYKLRYETFPKTREVLGFSGLDGYCYDRLKTIFPRLHTANLTTSIRKAVQRWKTDYKEILSGAKSIASYKANVPIDIHNNCISVYKEKDVYYTKLSLISTSLKKELKRKTGQFCVLVKEGDKSSKDILDRCIEGTYKVSASQIVFRNKKWLLHLSYTFETRHKELNPHNTLGIDMGIVYPVYLAIHNTPVRAKIDGGEIDSFRKQVEKRKKEMQRQGKYCGEGRIGHGTKTRVKPIRFAQEKISNFRSTTNHKYSRYIVDFALKNNCGTIQMEDLKGISTNNTFLKNWSYYDLQQKITYKAEEKGITVKLINPKYTSQRCSKCGYIDKENRPEQAIFECKQCGYKINADYNAALNIATPDIEKLISEV